jgi:hypothetical protein
MMMPVTGGGNRDRCRSHLDSAGELEVIVDIVAAGLVSARPPFRRWIDG